MEIDTHIQEDIENFYLKSILKASLFKAIAFTLLFTIVSHFAWPAPTGFTNAGWDAFIFALCLLLFSFDSYSASSDEYDKLKELSKNYKDIYKEIEALSGDLNILNGRYALSAEKRNGIMNILKGLSDKLQPFYDKRTALSEEEKKLSVDIMQLKGKRDAPSQRKLDRAVERKKALQKEKKALFKEIEELRIAHYQNEEDLNQVKSELDNLKHELDLVDKEKNKKEQKLEKVVGNFSSTKGNVKKAITRGSLVKITKESDI